MTVHHAHNLDARLPLPAYQKKRLVIKVDRKMVVTLIISLLLHLSLLWLFAPKLFSIGAPQKDAPPFEVSLGPPQKKETAPSAQVLPDLRPLPQSPKIPKKAKPVKKEALKQPPVKVAKKSKLVKPPPVNKTLPEPPPPVTSEAPLPGEDMQAYIKRQKAAKLAKDGLSKQDIEAVMASSNPQSAGDKRDAKIRKNLNLDGTSGIFSIRSLSAHRAQFSFKGWKNNVNTARLEIVDVAAPNGVDIKLAVIRKMISIIRREYQGDFKWDSHRLNRIIELSARVEDTEGLEAFMMTEFFGPGSPYRE